MILAARLTNLSLRRIFKEGLFAGLAGALLIGSLLYVVDVALAPQGLVRLGIGIAAGLLWLVAGPIRPMVLALRNRAAHATVPGPLPNAA